MNRLTITAIVGAKNIVHFTDYPATEDIAKKYYETGIRNVLWIQPNLSVQKEAYTSVATVPIVSQHICIPYWTLDTLDQIYDRSKAYLAFEDVEAVSLVDVGNEEQRVLCLEGSKKIFQKYRNIQTVILPISATGDFSEVNTPQGKKMTELGFSMNLVNAEVVVYVRS